MSRYKAPAKKKRTSSKSENKTLWVLGLILVCVFFLTSVWVAYSHYFLDKKFYRNEVFKGIYVNKNSFPITGIDLSKHSGLIDFEQLKHQNIDFVFLKATEGVSMKDRTFEKNYKAARKTHIPLGVYHFLRFNKDGILQAQNFLKSIKGKKFELPLVLDVESWSNPRKHDPEKVKEIIKMLLKEVRAHRSERLMIYTNENGYQRYIENTFEEDIWICSFNHRPKVLGNWVLWQHLHDESMRGVSGYIDLNTFNGSEEEWQEFLQKNQAGY